MSTSNKKKLPWISNLANGSPHAFSLVFKACLVDLLKHTYDISSLYSPRTSRIYWLSNWLLLLRQSQRHPQQNY